MTQRYFAESGKGLNIRNSSNFHVLMNNVDVRANLQVANIMGLKKEYQVAQCYNQHLLHPIIIIDRTNQARVCGLQLYVDIFSVSKIAVYNQMISYVISEADFLNNFKEVNSNLAVKNENPKPSSPVSSSSVKETNLQSARIESKKETASRSNWRQRRRQARRIKNEVGRALQQYQINTEL